MAFPDNFVAKKNVAYVSIANAVASESEATPNHDKRLAIAKQFANGGGSTDWLVTIDFRTQGYDDATDVSVMESRLSALLTNLVALGFGGA